MKLLEVLTGAFKVSGSAGSKSEEHVEVIPATKELTQAGIAQIIFDCCKEDYYKDTPVGRRQIVRGENPALVGKNVNDFDYDVEIRRNNAKYRLCVRIKEKGSTAEGYPYWILLDELNRGMVINESGCGHAHYRYLNRQQIGYLVENLLNQNPAGFKTKFTGDVKSCLICDIPDYWD